MVLRCLEFICRLHVLVYVAILLCFYLDVRFVSDLQAALSATDMALALNRYLCTAVLPLLTKCAPLFAGTEPFASLIDSLLHTVYRLSKGCCLTKAQRDAIEECLLAVCGCVRVCGVVFFFFFPSCQYLLSILSANKTLFSQT